MSNLVEVHDNQIGASKSINELDMRDMQEKDWFDKCTDKIIGKRKV